MQQYHGSTINTTPEFDRYVPSRQYIDQNKKNDNWNLKWDPHSPNGNTISLQNTMAVDDTPSQSIDENNNTFPRNNKIIYAQYLEKEMLEHNNNINDYNNCNNDNNNNCNQTKNDDLTYFMSLNANNFNGTTEFSIFQEQYIHKTNEQSNNHQNHNNGSNPDNHNHNNRNHNDSLTDEIKSETTNLHSNHSSYNNLSQCSQFANSPARTFRFSSPNRTPFRNLKQVNDNNSTQFQSHGYLSPKMKLNSLKNKHNNNHIINHRILHENYKNNNNNNNNNLTKNGIFSITPLSLDSQSIVRLYPSNERMISSVPYKILDAPNLSDDFYLNLVDWSLRNVVSVGLGTSVYLWSACNSKVQKLIDFSNKNNYVTRAEHGHQEPCAVQW